MEAVLRLVLTPEPQETLQLQQATGGAPARLDAAYSRLVVALLQVAREQAMERSPRPAS